MMFEIILLHSWEHVRQLPGVLGVRVLAPVAEGAEIADVAEEIVGFGAGVIVVAAGPDLVAAVRRMAGTEWPPVVVWPAPPCPVEGNARPAD